MTSTYRFRLSIFLIILPFVLLVAGAVQPAHAQARNLHWERFDVDITVLPGGDFVVEETQVIQFTSGTFREGYRSIPADLFSSIHNVTVTEDGVIRQVDVDRTDGEYEIVWALGQPRSNERHTYVLSYTVSGGLRYYDEGDQLWWKAVFPDRSYPVLNSTVTVHLPEGARAEMAEAYGAESGVQGVGERTVTFVAQEQLEPGQELEVRVQFPHGIVAGSPAAWQRIEDMRPVLNLVLGVIGAAILIVGPLGVLLLWYVRGRDPQVELPTDYLTEPPSDAPPGVAGTLVDEKADVQDIVATLVDLARRGYLEIEEAGASGFFSLSSDFIFRRTDKPLDDLLPFEQLLIGKLIGHVGERRMSSLKEKFYTTIPEIQKLLYNRMVKRGYFRRRPDTIRKIYSGIGVVFLFGVFFLGFGAIPFVSTYSGAFICPVIGLGATALGLAIVGQFMPAKTRRGAEEAARWQAFKRYLKEIQSYEDLEQASDKFEAYLPYAIAFGLEHSWINKFSRVETTPVPVWYIPMPVYGGRRSWLGGGTAKAPGMGTPGAGRGVPSLDNMSRGLGSGLDSMARGLGRMLDTTASTLTSRPASSSGSGGWSGGGFSGGGGGGGGGGGFR